MQLILRLGLAVGFCLVMGAAAAPAAGIYYRITPEFRDGALTALDVEMTAPGSRDGVDVLVLPEGSGERPTIADVRAEGGEIVDLGGGRMKLTRRRGAALQVRYRVLPEGGADPFAEPRGPVIRPDWFAVRGEAAFITPEGDPQARARVTIAPFPAGWNAGSSFAGEVALSRIGDSLLIGGRDYRFATRMVTGAPLTMAYPARYAPIAGPLLDRAAKVLAAERAFWRARGTPFFIGLVPLTDDGQYGGRGLNGGFELFLGARVPSDPLLHVIAHENLHSWISRRIGGFPKTDSDLEAWLNEGFTEAFTARILLSSELWSLDEYVANQNKALLGYGASPVKTEPNSRILADRQRDVDVSKLPYDRGRLLALYWDHALRAGTHGRVGLIEVLRAQEREAAAHPAGPSADRLFPTMVKRVAGIDLADEILRYVDRGEAFELPQDLFGPCARIVEVSRPVFDRGFNLGATMRAHGRVQELEPGGPADRAGLKAGDHILIDETPTRDSQVTLTYRVVEADGRERTVSYKPEGSEQVRFQQIELTPLARREPARCRTEMARP